MNEGFRCRYTNPTSLNEIFAIELDKRDLLWHYSRILTYSKLTYQDDKKEDEVVNGLIDALTYDLKFEVLGYCLKKVRSEEYCFTTNNKELFVNVFFDYIKRQPDYNLLNLSGEAVEDGLRPVIEKRITKMSCALYFPYLYNVIKEKRNNEQLDWAINTLPSLSKLCSRLTPGKIEGINVPKDKYQVHKLSKEIEELTNYILYLRDGGRCFNRDYCLYLYGYNSYLMDILLLNKALNETKYLSLSDFIDGGFHALSRVKYPCARYYLYKYYLQNHLIVTDQDSSGRSYGDDPGIFLFTIDLMEIEINKLRDYIVEIISKRIINGAQSVIKGLNEMIKDNPLSLMYEDLLLETSKLQQQPNVLTQYSLQYFQIRKRIQQIYK